MNYKMGIMKKNISVILFSAFLVFSYTAIAVEKKPVIIESPSALLTRISDDVIDRLVKQQDALEAEPDKLYDIVEKYIIPHLDDVTMAKLALGKNWRKATNDQKIEFVDQFRELLVLTYGKSLKEFTNQKMIFFPAEVTAKTKKVIVKSEVFQTGGPVIPVSYKMRIKKNAWKVYDISIDGVSLVTSYRGTFAQEVRKGGMEGLLSMLRSRNKRFKS